MGQRHLLQLLDYRVKNKPTTPYASMPIDENDISKGFNDISYDTFGNAINHCIEWLQSVLPPPTSPFETVAYTGPRDMRYSILFCALAKLERKLLVPNPMARPAAQASLVHMTECKVFLYGGELETVVHSVSKQVTEWDVKVVKTPELDVWLTKERAAPYEWSKSWEDARLIPCLVVHTSGTTGPPKPVVYNHATLVAQDASQLMPEYGGDCTENNLKEMRCYSPLPALHAVGIFLSILFPIILGTVPVFGPTTNTTPDNIAQVIDVLRYGNCEVYMAPPVFIEALVNSTVGLEALGKLDMVYFAGAAMRKSTAEKLMAHTRLYSGYGSTEAGWPLCVRRENEENWEYLSFRESHGIKFVHTEGDLHELVWVRRPELEKWQPVFYIYPELEEFHSGDLWVESKTRPGAWKVTGRTDDLLVFENSMKLNAQTVEMSLASHPSVNGIVVGGQGRSRPFVIIEWANNEGEDITKLEQLWPEIERVNEGMVSGGVTILKDMILFATTEKRLPRNVKGGVIRKRSEEMYEREIEQLY
ncbi:acetyl-CoA synthetase-like protein, partial [Dothidotthia symphoricarpi CBS 119687]